MLNIAICDDRPIQRKLLNLLIHEYEEQNGVRFNLEILFKPLQQEDINRILDEVLIGKVSETLLDDRARRLLRD